MNPTEQSELQARGTGRRGLRKRVQWVLLTRPWLVAHLFGSFCVDWLYTRRAPRFFAGLPAALTVLASLVVLTVGRHQADTKVYDRYWLAARTATDSKDEQRTELLLERLVQIRPNDDGVKFLRALCAERQDQPARARQLMRQIAPPDGRGYAKAYFWLAQDLAKNGDASDPLIVAEILQYLQKTLELDPSQTNARRALVNLYAQQKRFLDAAETWKAMGESGPSYWLTLAQLNLAGKQENEARRAAAKAAQECERRLEDNPEVPELHLMLAQAHAMQGDCSRAVQTLLQGLKQCGPATGPKFATPIAMAYAKWYDSLPKEQVNQRLELMTQAMIFGPGLPPVLTRLAQLTTEFEKGTEGFEPLYQALADGVAPAGVHLLLGTAAIETDPEEAIHHLEIVLQHQPHSSITLNNLAWALAHMPDADLDRAEKLADAAWELAPNQIEIRDTRGRIRAMRGNTQGAIADMEFVVRHEPNRGPAYELLATLYEQQGFEELAAALRKKIAKLSNSKP